MKTITYKQYREYLKLKRKKKRGFIDRCYVFAIAFICCIVAASFWAVSNSGALGITDMSPLTTTIEKAFEWAMLFTGFIVWKAKVENCRKHKDVNRLLELEENTNE